MCRWLVVLFLISTSLQADEIKALAFSGSTREASVNKKLIVETAAIARELGLNVTLIDLKDFPIPFYDEDLEKESGMPLKAKKLRQLMVESDVILIASPEYNGSLSAVLKNAIDWASRKEEGGSSRDAFKGKKFVILSAAPGAGGGARGLTHLRSIIENIGGFVSPNQIAIPDAFKAFDENGHLKDEKVKEAIKQAVQSVK